MFIKKYILLISIFLVGFSFAQGQNIKPTYQNIEYAKIDTISLKLDLYLPENIEKPVPLVIWIHGGSWSYGSKDYPMDALTLLPRGYAIASISYRFSQQAKFPAQINDVKGAVRFLRANAEKYKIDPNRFGVWGASAGGHLAALLGTTNGIKFFTVGKTTFDIEGDVGGNAVFSSDVQAVVDWYGPTNFTTIMNYPSGVDRRSADNSQARLIGGRLTDSVDKAALASPITYVSPDDPPFLIQHGIKDDTIPYQQSLELDSALKKNNVTSILILLEQTNHGGGLFEQDSTLARVGLFFDKYLKNLNNQKPIDWRPYFTLNPEDGLKFLVDTSAIAYDSGVPVLNITSDEKILLSHYGKNTGSFIVQDNGTRYQKLSKPPMRGADGTFIYLNDGGIRFIGEEPAPNSTPQKRRSRLVSWISYDGYNWMKEDGIRYQPGSDDDSISSVPAAIQLRDSVWRLYYVGDFYRTNGIRTAISKDWGLNWEAESKQNILSKGDVDPHPVYLTNDKIRLYFRTGMDKPIDKSGIAYCDSEDGLNFDSNQSKLIIPDKEIDSMFKLDPAVIKFPNGKTACFIGEAPNNFNQTVPKLIVAWDSQNLNISEIAKKDEVFIMIKPNPAKEIISVEYYLPISGLISIEIFDIKGKKFPVKSKELHQIGNYSLEISINNLKKKLSGNNFYLHFKLDDQQRTIPFAVNY
jgi:acetyl esterase/lipase